MKKRYITLIILPIFLMFFSFSFSPISSLYCTYETRANCNDFISPPWNCFRYIEHPEMPCLIPSYKCCEPVRIQCPATTSIPTTSVNWCDYLCAFNCNQNDNPPNCYNAIVHPDQACVISSMKCCEYVPKQCPVTTSTPTTTTNYCSYPDECVSTPPSDSHDYTPPDCYIKVVNPETPCIISSLTCIRKIPQPCPVTTSTPTTSTSTECPYECWYNYPGDSNTPPNCWTWIEHPETPCRVTIATCYSKVSKACPSTSTPTTSVNWCDYLCAFNCNQNDNPPNCYNAIVHPDQACVISSMKCCEFISKPCPITTTIPTTTVKYCEGQNHGCFLSCQDDNYPPDCYNYIEHPETPCAISPLKCCEILAKPCPVTTSIPTTIITTTTIPVKTCEEVDLKEFGCQSDWICRKYLKNDCTTGFYDCRYCEHGCSNGICIGESATIISTTLPDCPYQCLDTCDLVGNEPPDCWIKISHPKYYCPDGICCEVKSKECPECIADSQCNDDEVCLNEKCIKAKIILAFVPVNWDGSLYNFNTKVDNDLEIFKETMPLSGCSNLVKGVKVQEICNINCTEGINLYKIEECANRWTTSYDYVIGMTNNNYCKQQSLGGGFCCGPRSVFVDVYGTAGDVTTTHELGHQFGLSDEYCYNPNDDINPTTEDLCPFKTCCTLMNKKSEDDFWYNYCKSRYDPPASCNGNKNSRGGYCIMGYGSNGFCPLCLDHLRTIPQLNCW